MKKIIFLCLAICLGIAVAAGQSKSTVYFNDGTSVTGIVTESNAITTKVKLNNNKVFIYSNSEIVKISPVKEEPVSDSQTQVVVKRKSPWRFGVTGGYMVSDASLILESFGLSYDDSNATVSVSGFSVGGIVQYRPRFRSSLDMGFRISMSGFDFNGGNYEEYRRYMLDLPIYGTTYWGYKGQWFVQYGVNIGILLASSLRSDGYSYSAKGLYNPMSFGVLFGIGYGWLSLQFIQDFTNMQSSNAKYYDGDGYEYSVYRNWVSSLNLAVSFVF